MSSLIQCVPNFSEGVDQEVIQALVQVAQSVAGVSLLDYSSDASHNRSVFSLIGNPQGIEEVSYQLIEKASQVIDMSKHQGGHPRMGATDVLPLIPLRNTSVEECVELAHRIGQRVGQELKIPIYLYEAAAQQTDRQNLAQVRTGEYEGLADKLQTPEGQPDYGPTEFNAQAGATAIGVRAPLIAFNVNLNTEDVSIAQKIAKAVRGSSGGYKYCKAMGLAVDGKPYSQVSMNMVNYEKTPLFRVFETIKEEASRYGVSIVESEIIGLTPNQALIDAAIHYLQLHEFNPQQQIIENRLSE